MSLLSLSLKILCSPNHLGKERALLWSGPKGTHRDFGCIGLPVESAINHTRQSWEDINGTGKYHKWHGKKEQLQSKLPTGCRWKAPQRCCIYLVQPGTDSSCHCTECYSNIHLTQPFWGHLTAQDHVLHHILPVSEKARKI